MPTPELGLAAFDTGVECIKILVYIIRTAQNVKALKGECAETAKAAQILLDVLDKNKTALKDSATATRLKTILLKLSKFVTDCQSSNIFHRTWEVMWKHQLPGLLKQLMTLIAYFTMQTIAETRTNLLELFLKSEEIQQTGNKVETSIQYVLSRLEILDEIKKELAETRPPKLEITFSESDSRISITQQEGEEFPRGTLSSGNAESVDVVCIPIQENLMRFGEKGPRYALIYERLSANTLVHPYYGVAKRFGRNWAVMKDMRKFSSLNSAIEAKQLPDTVLGRLEIAQIIARTVAYLHSVDILIKRLSDTSIILSADSNGVITPYLTNLERARLFQEWTSGGEYDVRYEAPEFQKQNKPQHSVATDIWSLGVLVWHCVLQTFPFDFKTEITEGSDAANIRARIKEGNLPWKSKQKDPLLIQLSNLVGACCATRPNDRPSAAEVEHSLFEMLSCASIDIDLEPTIDMSSKSRAAELLAQLESDKASQFPKGVSATLANSDVASLYALADGGDSLAALYLGSAILFGLATPKDDDNLLELVAGFDNKKSSRARAAIPYLEFALNAGYKSAAKPLMEAHVELAKLYKTQHEHFRGMKSLCLQPKGNEP